MSDEVRLQITRKDDESSLVVLSARSSLVARGRWDAAMLSGSSHSEPQDPLAETRHRAEDGDASAQCTLSHAYLRGEGVPQDYAEALKWFRRRADAGSVSAAEYVGYFYYDGLGVAKDHTEAVKWLRKGTPSEFGLAELDLAKCYFYGSGVEQDYVEAVQWFLEALDGELYGATADEIGHFLSYIYALGLWGTHDRRVAVRQWRWADEDYGGDLKSDREHADRGNAWAQFHLGLAYVYGRGVTQDDAEAAKWFHKAAEAGDIDAQIHLGLAYFYGRGVTQDYVHAHIWINLAASASTGEWQSLFSSARDVLAAKMTPLQFAEAQALARKEKLKVPG